MAWPPAALPTNRTNATPQQNTHPADHNAISLAINDTVTQLQTVTTNQLRAGSIAQQTGQSVAGGATVSLSWTSVTDSSYGSGPTFTIPSGKGGLYVISLRVTLSAPIVTGGFGDLVITANTFGYVSYIPQAKQQGFVVAMESLGTGTTFSASVFNPNAGAVTYTARMTFGRVAL